MQKVIETNGLTKYYSRNAVVNDVSLTVYKGDIYGFVGKNGAGKTTLIRMLLGLTNPGGGSFELFEGEEPTKARRRIGSLVESPALYGNMTARENILMLCSVIGVDRSRADEVLETVGLSNTGRKKAKDFSLGMKQRLGIGLALLGDPELLILDEPINGLDPTGIVEIRELLLKLNKEKGITIFISSHILGELEKIATRYGIISGGCLVEELTAEQLEKYCHSRTWLRTDDAEKSAETIRKFLRTENIEIGKNGMVYLSDPVENIGALTNELFSKGITVSGIGTEENGAESYFIRKMEEVK